MTKTDLADRLSRQLGMTRAASLRIINTVFNEMSHALVKSGRIEIRGLFSMHVKQYKSYVGRNPKTGELKLVKPKKMPFFKCGRDLFERINNP